MPVLVRRVRLEEWREIRDLRLEAVNDPDAAIAFLTTPDEESLRDDAFWRGRAAGTAFGEDAAQFVAIVDDADDDRWVGTVTVLLRGVGSSDHLGRVVSAERADVVGVYVSPGHRGAGVLGRLIEPAAAWAAERGVADLTLDVHVDNVRAQGAYRRLGFAPTGEQLTGPIGPELVMRRLGSVSG